MTHKAIEGPSALTTSSSMLSFRLVQFCKAMIVEGLIPKQASYIDQFQQPQDVV